MEQNKNKKIMLSIIGVAILVIGLVGITYAFFNYTRTGSSNNIKVGRISFVSKDEETITLNNLFPIDPENTTDMNDTTKVGTYKITIEGDTDYSGGIEYLVSTTNSNLSNLPISINMTVGSGLGTSDTNYFTSRDTATTPIYKKIVGSEIVGDQMLLVGFIPQNTNLGTSDETGDTITIKAYLDKNKILISDTYDGSESDNMGTQNSMAHGKTVITTTEWNALQQSGLSFKVKVVANEGIWVKGSLEEIMRKSAVMDNVSSEFVSSSTGINFGAMSSDTNGKGVYMRAGTENDAYPIMYYRGAVEDNNVLFANQCWKAVRTTDTGGVKLIYNGELSPRYDYSSETALSQSDYGTPLTNNGFTFDTSDNSWNATMTTNLTSSDAYEISFNVPAGDGYVLKISGVPTTVGGVVVYVYKGDSLVNTIGRGGGTPFQLSHSFGTLTASDTIKVTYYMTGGNSTSENPSTIKVQMIEPDGTLGMDCNNSGTATQIKLNVSGTDTNKFAFNSDAYSPAYNGYMYGTIYYTSNYSNWTSGAKFGSNFTWDGTNYKLVDASVTTPNAKHHYSCNSTDTEATCTDLRYVFYKNGSTKYYVILTGGEGIEQAMEKMQTNTNNSNAKAKIDTWYASNLTSYTNKLEDTIWCNDRSMGDRNNNGWIANGGDLSTTLYYGAFQRSNYAVSPSTVKNQPSLVCTNKNDRFTVNNAIGNGALTYPTALLTADEIVMAGGKAGSTDGSHYLTSGTTWWSLSPYAFGPNYRAYEFNVTSDGSSDSNGTTGNLYGLRPAISIKPGQSIAKGTGTVTDPYVIE